MFLKSTSFARGALIGAILASLLVLFLTIFGELLPPLKNFLKDVHHHHWIGKGIWAGIIFVSATIVLHTMYRHKSESINLTTPIKWLSYVLIAATVLMFAFFVYEYGVHN